MPLLTLRIFILCTLICLSTTVFAQNLEPLELAKKIFSKEPFPNLKKYTGGEYDGNPNGQDIQNGSITHFMLLSQTETHAVVALSILDSAGKGLDTYLHFEKESFWKMHAFRALAMTGIIEQIKIELEKMTPQQVDELIEKAKKEKDLKNVIFSSREDYNYQLGNSRLTLELDDNIIKHFLDNKTEFERIKNEALNELQDKPTNSERSVELVESYKADYRKLFISSVSYGDYRLGGKCLDFSIGGMLDNTVGYIYVKDKNNLPEMTDRLVIMIREIGDGWYIYKTT